MTTGIYDNCFDLWFGGDAPEHTRPALSSDTIKVGIVNTSTDYTPVLATDQDWADVYPVVNECYGTEATQTLSAKTASAGVFDNTADITFPDVAIDGTKDVDAIVHYRSGGVVSVEALISVHGSFVGGAVTPNGGSIVIAYDGSGILAL